MDESEPLSRPERLLRLLRAVEHLALPHAVRTTQYTPTGAQTVSIVHEPLISRLRAAAHGSGGSGSGGASSSASQRSLLDAGALKDYAEITELVSYAWTILIPAFTTIPARWTLEAALASWADLFIPLAGAKLSLIPDDVVETASDMFDRWRHRIEEYFTPPRVVTNTRPCPSCGTEWWVNDDGEQARPIIMFAGRDLEHSHATCRVPLCGHTWSGEDGLNQLRKDQNDLQDLVTEAMRPIHAVSDTPTTEMPTGPIQTAVA